MPHTQPSLRSRVLLIDLLKAVAAQLIVLHHFAWYGPFSDHPFGQIFDGLLDWLSEYGRYAVAVFITTSGFLSAQLLSYRGLSPGNTPLCLIRQRYFRLVLPFAVALCFAVAADLLLRQWSPSDDVLGARPQWLQFVAHLFLLHGLLGVESLSAGVWYVAIEFQLYALFVVLLWLGRRLTNADFLPAALVLLMALASLLHFNRDAGWDNTAFYFFGSYALGIASGWAIRTAWRVKVLWLIGIVGILALWVDFRPRLIVSVLTALAFGSTCLHMAHRENRVIHYLGGTSYALFLIHYPVYLVVGAIFQRIAPETTLHAAWGLGVAWLLSMACADMFHRWVALPLERLRKRRLACLKPSLQQPASL
ncbi:MAG: acyltransferase [Rhodocyclaceae bacterium]|nr:acyltransferase [Rhodocyclaceae bacterium]MDZ4214516.1 acyltransferase [Rhodocyclaceae bacterium]